MARYKLTIEYDGGPFVGWQRQRNGPSVQAAIEQALLAFTGEPLMLYGAGRTDAGVHASGQVAHVDLAKDPEIDTVRDALNYHLKPQPIAVMAVSVVDAAFHARFSAIERTYEYCILARRPPATFDQGRVWHVPVGLNALAMQGAADRLLGKHDFTSFRAAFCQAKSPVKTLDGLDVERVGDLISVTARARSFLRSQVRALVGSIKLVGEGRWSADDVVAALEKRDRAAAGPTAPPDGLYLRAVRYPED
jgi:tRNA pseudouridine38-40 synthase